MAAFDLFMAGYSFPKTIQIYRSNNSNVQPAHLMLFTFRILKMNNR